MSIGKGNPLKTNRRHPLCIFCCAFVALIFIIAIILVIITFTLYKIKDPNMTLNSVFVSNITSPSNIRSSVVSVNSSAFIENPDAVALSYNSSINDIYYRGKLIAQTVGPPGVAPAKQTVLMNVTFSIKKSDLISDSRFLKEFLGGEVGFNTSTFVRGTVKPFGVVNKKLDVLFNCTVIIDMKKYVMKNSTCWTHLKL